MNPLEAETYEASKARQSVAAQPDKIHWDSRVAFRDAPYRQLHHQQGLMGRLRVRLVEASNLKRSYWSALALGPVKHLNLSKAHGDVSSYCTFSLEPSNSSMEQQRTARNQLDQRNGGRKPSAKPSGRLPQPFVSPKVENSNEPVWEHCQFDFPIRKGVIHDGQRILLKVQVHEDSTALENFLPGVPSGGDSRLLGEGTLDVTDLMLGLDWSTGQALPTVVDEWISLKLKQMPLPEVLPQEFVYNKEDPLKPPIHNDQTVASANLKDPPKETGEVRILVSYEPHGMEPQPKDVVALEAFARPNASTMSCRPVIPPLAPFEVLERRGPFLLCRYFTSDDGQQACVRLHRNTVFVIERQSLADAAHNLALLPADVWLATPLGQAIHRATGPLVTASTEVMKPALLSFRLLWVAFRTTTLAGLSGVQALGSTLWNEGSQALTVNHADNNSGGYGRQTSLVSL
jgi:hypothetical protein